MGRIFHPSYTRSLPAEARVFARDGLQFAIVTYRGVPRECEVREVRGRLRVFIELLDRWAVEWTDENGRTRARTVGRDKRMATAALTRYEDRAARRRHGLPDHAGEAQARGRPIMAVVSEYLAVLAGGDTSPAYREQVRQRLASIQRGCGWETWPDVSADGLVMYLGRLRDTKRKGYDTGLSPASLNGYLRAAQTFTNWYAARLQERNPLKGIKPYPEAKDRRRSRRILTDEEFARLLDATVRAPRRCRTIIRPADRAILYRVAAYSGLRASELARLTPAHLRLDADPPAIVVYGKGKREESTAIPGFLADILRGWIAGKKAGARLWPGKWAEHRRQVLWLRRDSKRAGLGPGVTFHSLRRRYVTALIRAGNEADVVRRMARHRDLRTTMNYYAEITPQDLKRAAESLKPPPAG